MSVERLLILKKKNLKYSFLACLIISFLRRLKKHILQTRLTNKEKNLASKVTNCKNMKKKQCSVRVGLGHGVWFVSIPFVCGRNSVQIHSDTARSRFTNKVTKNQYFSISQYYLLCYVFASSSRQDYPCSDKMTCNSSELIISYKFSNLISKTSSFPHSVNRNVGFESHLTSLCNEPIPKPIM